MPLSLLFSWLNSPMSLSFFSWGRCFRPITIFLALHWTLSRSSLSVLEPVQISLNGSTAFWCLLQQSCWVLVFSYRSPFFSFCRRFDLFLKCEVSHIPWKQSLPQKRNDAIWISTIHFNIKHFPVNSQTTFLDVILQKLVTTTRRTTHG